jgi:hypothetical protein
MTDWGIPAIERLKTLWMAGRTATEIAFEFADGRSRNSIIGKVHALGLKRPPKAKRKREPGALLSTKGYRKAYASKGDSPRARFVRVAQEPGVERHRRANKMRLPGFEADFIQEGRTKFAKSVKAPDRNILVSGHNNIKIGRIVQKGPLRGYYIFTLSLEERKTCPSSCQHWQSCYGNNMPFAKRVDHTDPQFYQHLEFAVSKLCAQAENRGSGVLARLHALGDFFSVDYAAFWQRMLVEHENLVIYGYTAHPLESPIGWFIAMMNSLFDKRCMVRFSNGGMMQMSTVSIGEPESCPPDAFICPEQTGKTDGCDTCALCWSTRKNVAFLEH